MSRARREDRSPPHGRTRGRDASGSPFPPAASIGRRSDCRSAPSAFRDAVSPTPPSTAPRRPSAGHAAAKVPFSGRKDRPIPNVRRSRRRTVGDDRRVDGSHGRTRHTRTDVAILRDGRDPPVFDSTYVRKRSPRLKLDGDAKNEAGGTDGTGGTAYAHGSATREQGETWRNGDVKDRGMEGAYVSTYGREMTRSLRRLCAPSSVRTRLRTEA